MSDLHVHVMFDTDEVIYIVHSECKHEAVFPLEALSVGSPNGDGVDVSRVSSQRYARNDDSE